MKIYSKNQIGIIIIIVLGIFYSEYLNRKYHETIESGKIYYSTVLKQNCHSGRISSNVKIFENNKEYYVKLDRNRCENYPINSKIKIFYNYENDEFIFKVNKYNGKRRTVFLIVLFAISFLPWSYWISKLEKKNCS